MMKKAVLVFVLALLSTASTLAQLQLEGDDSFGRLEDLTYDLSTPNTIYALTLRSHIVVSYDSGDSWELFYTFPDENARIQQLDHVNSNTLSFFVSQTAIAAQNTLYLLDIDTAQISKQYTAPITPGATYEWIDEYDIYQANPDVAILNSNYRIGFDSYYVVYYTTDGGDSWTAVYFTDSSTVDPVSINNVAIDPTDPNRIFLSRGPGPTDVDGGLLVSTDGGLSFTEKLAGFELNAFKFHPTETNKVYLGSGWGGDTTLYVSEDSGDTWSIVPISWDDTGVLRQINYIEIDEANNDNIIILSGDEIAVSADGGLSWTNTVYDIDFDPYVYGMKASYNPFTSGEVMITTDKYPQLSTDGGITLTQVENPFFHSKFTSYNPNDGGHLYYGLLDGIGHKDMTTGEHSLNHETPLGSFTINPKSFYPDRYVADRAYYRQGTGVTANLLKLENYGATITDLLIGAIFSNVVDVETDPNNNDIVWISFDDGVTRRFDTSSTSTYTTITLPVTSPAPPAPQVLHFTTFIDPTNSDHVLIGQGGRVFESFDQGASWTEKSNGIDTYLDAEFDIIYDLEQNPFNANELMASTSQGIFKTTDFGENWERVFTGTYLRKIEYSTVEQGVVFAAIFSSLTTEAHFVYTEDNGDSWTTVGPDMLDHMGSTSMAFQFESGNVYVYMATYDSGLVKYTVETEVLSTADEQLAENTLSIYPNPVVDVLNIALPNGLNPAKVEIFSISGQKVFEAAQTQSVSLSALSTGIYIVKVTDNQGDRLFKKIIKR